MAEPGIIGVPDELVRGENRRERLNELMKRLESMNTTGCQCWNCRQIRDILSTFFLASPS